jgi:hypothetical protein
MAAFLGSSKRFLKPSDRAIEASRPFLKAPDRAIKGSKGFLKASDGAIKGSKAFLEPPDGAIKGSGALLEVPHGALKGSEDAINGPKGFLEAAEHAIKGPERFIKASEHAIKAPACTIETHDRPLEGKHPATPISPHVRFRTTSPRVHPKGWARASERRGADPTMSTTGTTATLNGHHGTLRLTVLGYELPDATDEGGEWLVARVEWESRTARVGHEGAILLTNELDALAAALAGGSDLRPCELRFLEPHFALTRCGTPEGGTAERVRIAILGDPPDGHEAFEASTAASTADIRAFGRALQKVAASLRVTACPAAA